MADQARFTLKLIDKVRGPSRTMARALGKSVRLFEKFQSSVNGRGVARNALPRFTAGGTRATRMLGGLTRRMGGMMNVFKGNLLARGAEGLLRIGAGALAGAASFVTFGQNQRLAFNQLAKHGASGAKIFQHTRDMAKEFGLDVKDTSKTYAKFLALQFSPKQADDLIKLGSDMRALGNSAEDVAGINLALGQIKSKGRLQGEELLQLQERNVSGDLIKKAVAKRMEVDPDKVEKLISAGKVKSDVALGAIQDAMLEKLGTKAPGEAGKKFANTTISGALGVMKARGQDLALTLAERFEGGATKFIKSASDKIFGFLDSAKGQKFIDRLALGFENAGKALEKAVPFVESFFGGFSTGAGEAMKVFGEALDPVFKALGSGDGKAAHAILKSMGKTFGVIAVTAGMVGGAFLGVTAATTVLTDAGLKLGVGIVKGILGPMQKMVGDVLLWWEDLSAIWSAKGLSLSDKAFGIGKNIVMGLVNGLKELALLPVRQAESIASSVLSAFRSTFQERSPAKTTIDIGANVGKGLPIGIVSQASAAERAIEKYYGTNSSVMGAFSDVAIPQPNYGEAIAAFAGGNNSSAAGASARGDISVSFGDINVQAPTSATPEAYGEAARRAVRREVEMLLAELELQA